MSDVKFIALARWSAAFDVSLTAELRKLGIRPEWNEQELCQLPRSLFDRLKKHGAPFSTDPADLENGRDMSHRNRLWFEAKEAGEAVSLAHTQEHLIEDEVNRMLALERAQKIAKLREQAKKKLGIGG